MSKRQRKSVRKPAKRVTARRGSPTPGTTPVEKAWLEFVDKFQAFTAKPHNEENKEAHKAWEKALRTADNAACAVMAEAATCLSNMELKIQAWAFRSAVEKRNDLAGLANWQPREGYESNSVFIASLRDDIRLIETSIGTAEDPELIKLGERDGNPHTGAPRPPETEKR